MSGESVKCTKCQRERPRMPECPYCRTGSELAASAGSACELGKACPYLVALLDVQSAAQNAVEALELAQNQIAGSRDMCDEPEGQLWDLYQTAINRLSTPNRHSNQTGTP
jgi:hypothetical protein